MTDYLQGDRILMVCRLPNGQYAATAWDPTRGEMYLPDPPIKPADTLADAETALDAYAAAQRLQEYQV